MDINELQSFKLSDAVKFHDELNPNLWTKDGKLLPEVQEQLEKIAEDFVVSLGISDLKVKDITISGSNAAYSYTPHSDLDLHVLVDFNELPNDEVYKELFNAKKTVYNDTHDIKINNIPVELYVQDTNQKHTSLGEYSVKNKDWVKFPIKRRANLDQKETKLKYEKLGNLIELAITLKDLSRIDKVLDTLKRYRRAGLEKTGEFGPENLAYKLIRKQGLLQALIDTKNEVHSQNLSLPEDQVLEVIDMPKKNYSIISSRYYADEINFTTKKGNDYMVGFRNDVYKNRPNLSNKYPKFKSDIDERHQEGKEVYFDNLSDDSDARKDDVRKDISMQDTVVPLTDTGDEFEVFSKVSDIINYYLRTRKPKYLLFATDERRANLYKKIFKKLLNDFSSLRLKKIPYKNNTDIYIAYDSNYFQDDKDVSEAIDLKKLVDDPKKLKTHDTHISPQEAYRRLLNGEKDEYLVLAVAKDAEFSYLYARDVLKKRFPLGEPAIAKDAHYSFMYALDVLKKRFPLGEPTIAKDALYSYWYARDVLDEPFPLGEPAIAKDVACSYFYALQVLGKPFPLGEPVISTDANMSYDYAFYVLYKPFPLGEPAIYNSSYRKDYEKYVLDGRPWTGLKKKKVKEAIDLKKLVSDPKKLKTSDTHISPEDAYERVANGEKDEYLIRAIAKSGEFSYLYAAEILKKRFPLGEPAIARSADYSCWYAADVLKGPFPLGEPAIAKDDMSSFLYARDILDEPFPLGEPAIAEHASFSYFYALQVLGKPFPLGEPAISTNAKMSYNYAINVLYKPFPLGEPAIAKDAQYSGMYEKYVLDGRPWTGLKKKKVKEAIDLKKLVSDPEKLKTHGKYIGPVEAYKRLKKGETDEYLIRAVAKDPMYSCKYAENVLKGPFPLAEPTIAKDAEYSYHYATEILKGPFPLGEPEIAKSGILSYAYALVVLRGPFPLGEPAIYHRDRGTRRLYEQYVLKGKPWTNIDQKVDEAIDLKNLVDDPKKLQTYDTHIGPKEAVERLKKGETDEYLLRVVAKYPKYACYYAEDVLKGPFPLGEPAIAKSADYSYVYARYVLKGPFALGEPAIAKDAEYSYKYAKDALKGPFALGEPSIAKSVPYSCYYAADVLKKPWPLVEPAIAKDAEYSYLYARYVLEKPFPLGEPTIAKNGLFSYEYAEKVLKGPFPLGEPAMAKSDAYSYQYAKYVLGKPFPLGEPAIYKNSSLKSYYIQEVLKGRPWTNIDQKIDEAIDLKKLVIDPKKLTNLDRYVEPKIMIKNVRDYAKKNNGIVTTEMLKMLIKEIGKEASPKMKRFFSKLLKAYSENGIEGMAKNIDFAIHYIYFVRVRCPILEPILATRPKKAFLYAHYTRKPFPLGEPAISKSSEASYRYAKYDLKGPFPKGEPAIAKDGWFAYDYAVSVIKKPFPLGEPAIAKGDYPSYRYALNVLNGPFPLGEPVIYDSALRNAYEKFVLKDRLWTNKKKKKVDEAIDLKNLVSDPKKLKTVDTHISADEALEKLKQGNKNPLYMKVILKSPRYCYIYALNVLNGPFPLGEPTIAKDPVFARIYAERVLKNSFPLGEPTIAKDAHASKEYAMHVLKSPFPLGEPAIATDAHCAMIYAKYVLKGPFALGEPAIAKNPESSDVYARDVLKGPWPLGEPAIARSSPLSLRYARKVLKGPFPKGERSIARSPLNSYYYARDVLEDSFPKGERVISKNGEYSYWYAKDVLKGPFPLGEPAIARSGWRIYYERDILKGRPWTGLDQKVDEAIDLKKLVSNPKKLKTVDTHISPEEAFKRLKKGKTNEYLVRAITKSVEYSFYYAKDVLKKPFPLGEPTIAKSAIFSYMYAKDILKGTFPMGEPTIAKDEIASYMYARDVLNGPFALGEPAIVKSAYYSYLYAKDVLKGPFALGEPTIAKDALESYHYARDVLKGPFPLGEPTIYKDNFFTNYYIKNILKGKPRTGLDQKVDEAIDLKNLVTNPKKLKTHKTHISPQEAFERLENGETDEYLIRAVAKSAEYSYRYASKILKGPFPLGEPAIAKDIEYSYWYARDVLNGPFALGEPAIATDGWISTLYAEAVLKGPFPLAEPAIAKDALYSYRYAAYVLKKPFPLGEPAIAKDAKRSYHYARHVLKNTFPLGEPAIYKDNFFTKYYIKNILKGKPWTGLDQPITETNIDESASGYIPSKKEANDPRYSMALTVDIKPDTMQQNAKKLGWKISRRGTPPLLFKPKA